MCDSSVRTTHAPAHDDRFSVPLRGQRVDVETRCVHYDGTRDVIAIRYPCCDVFYPCHACHQAATDHAPARWGAAQRTDVAVLCGVCRRTLTIASYLEANHACPACGAEFNPGCRRHWDKYFAFAD